MHSKFQNEIVNSNEIPQLVENSDDDFQVSQEEWLTAIHFLKDAEDGTKLTYSATPDGESRPNKPKLFEAIAHYNASHTPKLAQTKYSFIKLHGEIYAIGRGKGKNAIIGEGGFGKVKKLKNSNSQVSLMKIGKNSQVYTLEGDILKDLNMSLGQIKIKNLSYSEDKTHLANTNKSVLPMPFLGKTLAEVLIEEKNTFDESAISISYKNCFGSA